MIDLGTGTPLVLVPGIQGRWEWMRPTVEALATHFRVLSFSLAGERTSGHVFDPALGFDNFIVQVDRVLAEAGVGDAVLCGVSYQRGMQHSALSWCVRSSSRRRWHRVTRRTPAFASTCGPRGCSARCSASMPGADPGLRFGPRCPRTGTGSPFRLDSSGAWRRTRRRRP